MKKISRVLKQLSDLYEFNRRIKGYTLKKEEAANKRSEREAINRRDPQSKHWPGYRIQAMKLKYYPDTDSLYIDLSAKPSVDSQEISEGVVLDYDESGSLVGIDIDNASKKVDLHELMIEKVPFAVQTMRG